MQLTLYMSAGGHVYPRHLCAYVGNHYSQADKNTDIGYRVNATMCICAYIWNVHLCMYVCMYVCMYNFSTLLLVHLFINRATDITSNHAKLDLFIYSLITFAINS